MSDHADLRCLAAEAIERAAVSPTATDRAHVAACDACRREVDEARSMNAMLRGALREAPAPETIEAVWRRLEQSRNVVPFANTRRAPPRRLLAWASVAAAAAAAVVYVAHPAPGPTPSQDSVAHVAAPPMNAPAAPSATAEAARMPAAHADAAQEPRTPRRDGPAVAATPDLRTAPRLVHRAERHVVATPASAVASAPVETIAEESAAPARGPSETRSVDAPTPVVQAPSDEHLVDHDTHEAREHDPHFARPEPSRASTDTVAASRELGTTASALVGTDTGARDGTADVGSTADTRQPLRVRHDHPLTLDRIERRDDAHDRREGQRERRDEQRDRRDEQRQRRNERQDRRRDERQGRPGGAQGR